MHTPGEHLRVLTRAWLLLCCALAIHVADEAITGFLPIYKATVLAVRSKGVFFPAPLFTFGWWLAGLILVCIVLFGLSLWVVRGSRAARIAAAIFGAVMLLNGLAHITGTIRGRTVDAVKFARPMPGFYSSLLLLPAAVYLLVAVRRAGRASTAGLKTRAKAHVGG